MLHVSVMSTRCNKGPLTRYVPPLPRRCFAIYGGAGSGKSTVSAALVSDEATRPHAWHFCKHNDRRRADPIRMFRTIAYQLAFSIPVLQPWLLRHLESHSARQFTQVRCGGLFVGCTSISQPLCACPGAARAQRAAQESRAGACE